jgi:hypothetical protein
VTPGVFLVDADFVFHDGDTAQKILVTLGTLEGVSLTVKTTSKGACYALDYGCQSHNRFPCFHLPKNSCCLPLPTWICLDEFYELKDSVLVQRHFSGRVRHIGTLPQNILEQLLECVLECDDISPSQKKIVLSARTAMG